MIMYVNESFAMQCENLSLHGATGVNVDIDFNGVRHCGSPPSMSLTCTWLHLLTLIKGFLLITLSRNGKSQSRRHQLLYLAKNSIAFVPPHLLFRCFVLHQLFPLVKPTTSRYIDHILKFCNFMYPLLNIAYLYRKWPIVILSPLFFKSPLISRKSDYLYL